MVGLHGLNPAETFLSKIRLILDDIRKLLRNLIIHFT
jgi:hypothetical protein